MASRAWTSDDLEYVESALRTGMLLKDVAETLGRSFDSVASRCRVIARRVKEERRSAAEHPTSFTHALKQFRDYRDAAEWMGATRKAALSMALRNWVPKKYWPGLLRGLNDGLGLSVSHADLEAMAASQGRQTEAAERSDDWSAIPDMERRIEKIINSKYRDHQLARDAAGHAVLEMMDRGKPYLGYGVRCAFCYVIDQRQDWSRTSYLSDDEVQAAVDIRVWTPANQLQTVELNRVLRVAAQMPSHQRFVLERIAQGDTDAELAEALGVSEIAASREKKHTRDVLKALLEIDEDYDAAP